MISRQNSNNRKKLKAFGLVEVLVAIAISGVLMMGAVNVAANSLRTVKENESKDAASGILLRSLEITRSPVSFNLNSKVIAAGDNYFKLANFVDATRNGNTNGFDLIAINDTQKIADCTTESEYLVDTLGSGLQICNQIIVADRTPAGGGTSSADPVIKTFEVKSVVVYKYLNRVYIDELNSYRSELVVT